MLLNFAAPQLAPNIVAAPQSTLNVDAALGLKPSQYEGLKSVGDTGYYYGNNRMYEPYTIQSSGGGWGYWGGYPFGSYYNAPASSNRAEGTLEIGNQAFKPVDVDVTGFTKTKGDNDIYIYDPSMAYVYSKQPTQTYTQTPSTSVYKTAIGDLLSAPTMNQATGNYGAGRFLNTGNLLGFNFGTPSGSTTSGSSGTP